jgi:hypothetical protein
MTGVDDYISDGETVIKVSNGHELVSTIRGGSFRAYIDCNSIRWDSSLGADV